MAKKVTPDISDVFAQTAGAQPGQPATPADNSDLKEGNIRPLGVGLREGEIDALKAIAAELGGLSVNSLCHWAIVDFIHRYRAGKIDLAAQVETPPPPKKRLKMPK